MEIDFDEFKRTLLSGHGKPFDAPSGNGCGRQEQEAATGQADVKPDDVLTALMPEFATMFQDLEGRSAEWQEGYLEGVLWTAMAFRNTCMRL